jgi:hypothetical protein
MGLVLQAIMFFTKGYEETIKEVVQVSQQTDVYSMYCIHRWAVKLKG